MKITEGMMEHSLQVHCPFPEPFNCYNLFWFISVAFDEDQSPPLNIIMIALAFGIR